MLPYQDSLEDGGGFKSVYPILFHNASLYTYTAVSPTNMDKIKFMLRLPYNLRHERLVYSQLLFCHYLIYLIVDL